MCAPVTQSEWASPTANTTLPTASETAPIKNRRSQVSAAGEKIWPIQGTGTVDKPRFSTSFALSSSLKLSQGTLAVPVR